ncbi:MAG: hypothetical protein WB473_03395 [Pedococcus sp.]
MGSFTRPATLIRRATIEVRALRKTYGATVAVDEIDLAVIAAWTALLRTAATWFVRWE